MTGTVHRPLELAVDLGSILGLNTMAGINAHETSTYIAHHVNLARRSDTLFSDDAIELIHQVARGLPRAVNNLAVQALIAAYATGCNIVDESSTHTAITE